MNIMQKFISRSFFSCAVICLSLLAISILALDSPVYAQSRSAGIAAIVNQDAISINDVNERMLLVMSSSGIPNKQEIRDRLKPQIINTLIDEKLKIQQAAEFDLVANEDEINRGFSSIAGQNNLSAEEFKALLGRQGVSANSLEDQIRSQVAWSKFIQRRVKPRITIAANEVNAVLDRMRSKIGTEEYRIFEIYLPVNETNDENNVRQLGERLYGELISGKVPFQRVASQFSQSPGASQKGGDLGWVQEKQLVDILDQALQQMNKGDVSRPIRSLSGYHILMMADKRQIMEDTLPSKFQVEQDLTNERINLMQRRHLIDAKATAFIERRIF